MARPNRADYPGAFHHVMVRGMDRRKLFEDKADYLQFRKRLGNAILEGGGSCYAWSLMPNHAHLFLRTGSKPLSNIMQIVLAGYGLYYNRRRKRTGYVYQGRFKSILCEKEPYFLELIRYVHLNPVRAGIVAGLAGLSRFPWTGHPALLGRESFPWQAATEVLAAFGKGLRNQREGYLAFLAEGLSKDHEANLSGIRLMRAIGGRWDEPDHEGHSRRRVGEELILGRDRFVEDVLKKVDEREMRWERLKRQGWNSGKAIRRAAEICGLKPGGVRGNGKKPAQCKARYLSCKWMVEDLGLSAVETAGILRIVQPAVVACVKRGRRLEMELGVRLEDSPSRGRKSRI